MRKSILLLSGFVFLLSFFSLSYVGNSETEESIVINVKIEEEEADPGDIVNLALFLRNQVNIGGFQFIIKWDPNYLTLLDATRGDLIDSIDFWVSENTPHYMFEKFYYEFMPCYDVYKKKVKVVGIADMPDGYQGYPIKPNFTYDSLVFLEFQIKYDFTLRGRYLPVSFEWDTTLYDENILVDPSGYILYVSADPLEFPYSDTIVPLMDIVRGVYFIDGGILIPRGDSWRGDVNVNGYPYEMEDAELFSDYFIHGWSVFSDDPYWREIQINATDVNADGITLSISDLAFLIRVITGDALPWEFPFPPFTYDTAYVYTLFENEKVKVFSKSSQSIRAIYLLFTYTGTVDNLNLRADMDIKFTDTEDRLKVLLWSLQGKTIPADSVELFAFDINGEVNLISVEVADSLARKMNYIISQSVDVPEQDPSSHPTKFQLFPNYPNPFNPATTIEYFLPKNAWVNLSIYNLLGQKIKTLINEHQKRGLKAIKWDGEDENGNKLSSGVYFYKLKTKDFVQSKKMLLIK